VGGADLQQRRVHPRQPGQFRAQGNTNVTNGCINLSTGDAEQYFNTAVYGDPVEVTGTSIQLSYADGDIWDWAVDWDLEVHVGAAGEGRRRTSRAPPPSPDRRPDLVRTPTTTTTTSTPPATSTNPTTTTTSSTTASSAIPG
jgi:hypothetical protein